MKLLPFIITYNMKHTQYEYYRIENPSNDELKALGLDGWKAVTAVSRNDGHTIIYLFYRKI